LSEST